MITAGSCLSKFGDPRANEAKHMRLWIVPSELCKGKIPKRIYCNSLLIEPLRRALSNIINRGLIDLLHTWDGCFYIRPKKGGHSLSMHAWGLAVDINAQSNMYGHRPTMPKELVACFMDTGLFDWGGLWHTPDGMHFQLKTLNPTPVDK